MSQSQGVHQKLEQLKAYIPFVERMISKLESRTNHEKGEHLEKLRSLYKFLTNPDSRLQNIEMLERMEKIIKGMYKSVGKAPSANVPLPSKPAIEDARLIESEKRDSSKERYSSDGHSSHRKHDRRDSRGSDSRSSHRDHHSSRNRDRRDGRSRSRDRDRHRRSRDRDERHRHSSRDSHHRSSSRDDEYSKSKAKDSHTILGKLERTEDTRAYAKEKETISKGSELSISKKREKELFGDDKDFILDKNIGTSSSSSPSSSSLSSSFISSFSKDQVKGSRSLKQSLLDLPMPPVQNDAFTSLNPKPYLDVIDTKGRNSLPKAQNPPVSQALSSKVDLLKRKIGLLDNPPKPKYNFHEFKFNETSLGSLSLNEKEDPSLYPVYKEELPKELSHSESQKLSSRNPPKGSALKNFSPGHESLSKMPPPPLSVPPARVSSSSSSLMSLPLSRAITTTLKPTDIPLPTYPLAPPAQSETPQSPEHEEPSFSPHLSEDNNVKTIPLEKSQPPHVPEPSPLAQVNMEAIQKALNFINAHDKSKRSERPNVSYRYEDFIGPATTSTSKSEYYNPEETWESMPTKESSLGSMDEDLRKKDVDLRQIPGQFIPRPPPPPPSSSHFPIPNKKQYPVSPITTSAASKFTSISTSNYSINSTDSNWYSSHENRRGPPPAPLRDAKDTDMRTLLSTGQQSSSYVSSTSPKISPLSTPTSSEPSSSSSDINKSLSKKSELSRLDASSKKPEISKLDSIRTRVAHDQDKLIKLGQKGVAASQLETYKQKRERYLANPNKPTPSKGLLPLPSESQTNVPSSNKTSSQSLLDTLLPESSDDNKIKDVHSTKKEETPSHKDPTIMKTPLLSKPGDKEPFAKELTRLDTYLKNKNPSCDIQKTVLPESVTQRATDVQKTPFKPDGPLNRVSPLIRGDGLLPTPTRESLCNKPPFMTRTQSLDNSAHKFTKGLDNKIPKDPRSDPSFKDFRKESLLIREPRIDSIPRDPRSENLKNLWPSDLSHRFHRPDVPLRDPRSEKWAPRDPRSEASISKDQRIPNTPLIPPRRDPRLNQNEFHRDPRTNVYQHNFPRDPRVGLIRDPPPQEFQPRPLYNADARWNPMGNLMRPPFPFNPPAIAPVAPIPIAPVQPAFKPGPSPKDSAIGQTFTCLMMQGLPHYANSSHIYRFFEEYLLSDICIELDQSYNCKGIAYIHFPTHSSAKAALEKENDKFMNDNKIYLRICSLGILKQAKRTHDLQNIDREKYLNIPPRPRGNGNPFYKKPKTPPPVIKEVPKSPSQTLPSEKEENKGQSKEEDTSKTGYSKLCGVKIDSHGAKGLQSFKIPKLKKVTSSEETLPEETTEGSPDMMVPSVSSKLNSNNEKNTVPSSGSDTDDLVAVKPHTKKNRRYRKIVKCVDSESESDKEHTPQPKKITLKSKKQRGRLSVEAYDSDDEDSMIIDESANLGSDQDSNLSDMGDREDPSQAKEKVFEDLLDSCKKEKSTTPSVRGRKKKTRTVRSSPKGQGLAKKAPQFKVKGRKISPNKKSNRRGKVRKVEILNIEKTKITRQKHEILSPKKKLQVIIPTPFKLVYCLVTEDKISKRAPRRLRAPVVSISPVPSETSSNASVLPDLCEHLSSQESDTGISHKVTNTSNYTNSLSSDAEKDLVKSNSDSESCHNEVKDGSTKRLLDLPSLRKAKRRKKVRNHWQKGYKRSCSPLPDIQVINWKRCYSPPLQDYRNSSKTKTRLVEYAKNSQELSSLNVGAVSVFDQSIMDDTELADLTQITPTITDKEMNIFTVLPELSTIESVIGSDMVETQKENSTALALEETKEKRIKMISDDLVESANKFAEKESRQQSTLKITNTSDVPRMQKIQKLTGSDDEEDSLSCKVNQLVASLDESISTSKETSNINATDVSDVTQIELNSCSHIPTVSTSQQRESFNEETLKESLNLENIGDDQKKLSIDKPKGPDKQITEVEILSNIDFLSNKVSLTDSISEQGSPHLSKKSELPEILSPNQDSRCSPIHNKLSNEEKETVQEVSPLHTSIEKVKDHFGVISPVLEPAFNQIPGCLTEQEVTTTAQEKNFIESNKLCPDNSLSNYTATYSPPVTTAEKKENLNQISTIVGEIFKDEFKNINKFANPLEDRATVTEIGELVCENEPSKLSQDGETVSENKLVHEKEFSKPLSDTAEDPFSHLKTSSSKVVLEVSSTTCEISSRDSTEGSGNSKVSIAELSLNKNNSASLEAEADKHSLDMISSSAMDAGTESDLDDGASSGLASMSSFPDDTSVMSNDGREGVTPDPPSQVVKRSSKRDKVPLSSGLIERRRITRGSMVVPQVDETILWDDGGIVDLFQCDQCDYVGKQRVSHLINFHTDREVPCEFRKEDYSPVLRESLGPIQPAHEVKKLNLSWLPKKMTFDEEIECRVKDCDYNTNSRFDFFYHILEHKPQAVGSAFHCRLCNFMSDELEQFYNHVSSHTGEYRHTCVRCGQRAFCIEALVHHHKDYHGSQSQEFTSEDMILEDGFPYLHVCRACHHVQISLSKIEEHIQSKHSGKVDYVKANMSRHIVLHSDKKMVGEVLTSVKRKESELGLVPKPSSKVPKRVTKVVTKVAKGSRKLKSLKRKKYTKLGKLTGVTEDRQLIDIPGYELQSTDVPKDEHQSTDVPKDEHQSTDVPKDEHQSNDVLNDEHQSTGVPKDEDQSADVLEGEHLSTDVAEDEDQSADVLEGEHLSTDVAEDEHLSTDVPKDEHPSTDVSKVEYLKDKHLTINVAKDKHEPTSVSKDEHIPTEVQKDERELSDISKDEHDSTNIPKDGLEPTDVPKDDHQSTSIPKDIEQFTDIHLEKAMNVPVFLGQDQINETTEKAEEKEAEELVNRILLNNHTSRSSLEIKKKISSLDSILKKVDDDSKCDTNVDTMEEYSESIPEKQPPIVSSQSICDSLNNTVHNSAPIKVKAKENMSLTKLNVDTDCSVITVPTSHQDMKELKKSENIISESENQPKSITPTKRRIAEIDGEEAKKPLIGIISRLRTQLAEDDVLARIKEKEEKRAVSPLNSSQPSDAADDSDSDHLIICEDEGESVPTTTSTTEGSKQQTLKEQQQQETKSRDSLKCRLNECSFTGTSNQIGAHGWTSHRLYMCIFPACTFISVSDKLYNLHFENTHKIRKFGCPFRCVESSGMMSPSDMIKHIAKEHFISKSKERTYPEGQDGQEPEVMPIDPARGSVSVVSSEPVAPSPNLESLPFVKKEEKPFLLPAPLVKQEDKCVTSQLQLKNEVPDFPGAETLPLHPPTVPLLPLFTEFQSHRTFLLYTGSKAPEVFKCMEVGCSFVSDDSAAFESHSNNHFTSDHRCCYCFMRINSGKALVEHILSEHSHCPFQCKYCLYRAYTKVYLGVHLRKFHPDREPRYIKVGTLRSDPPPNPAIENFVHPYKCTFAQCTFRSVDTDAFKAHTTIHGSNVRMQCIFCEVVFDTEGLLKHMHVHMMNEYQCPYCLFGEAEREKLLTHLLNCHPGRPGKVLLRRQVSNSASGNTKSAVTSSSSTVTPTVTTVTTTTTTTTITSKTSTTPPVVSSQILPDISSTVTHTVHTSVQSTTSSINDSSATSVIVGSTSTVTTTLVPNSLISSGCLVTAKGQQKNEDVLSLGSTLFASSSTATSEPTALEQTGLTGTALYRCGNEKCEYSCSTQLLLKEHLQVCDFSRDSPQLRCFHCSKNFRHLSGLLDHIKVHGPKRYLCGVEGCDYRGTMPHYFKNHMKQVHHHSGYKIVLKDFSNKNPETQEFIVYPKDVVSSFKEPHKKRRNEYGVDDLDKIPRTHVAYQELKCYHCMYASKVRLNLIKHLKLHQRYPSGIPTTDSLQEMVKAIPSKQPVNPVPRLERKELMFDKMMNLAGSSFEDRKKTEENDLRLKYPIPAKELDSLPGFVPEEQLNYCGIDGCKYLSCNEIMLKCHIRTLHSEVEFFPCPHCTDTVLTLDKFGAHLKLHGENLYRCGWCSFLTPRKALVERHLTESHGTKTPFDFCIRGSDRENDDSEVMEANGRKGPAAEYIEPNDDVPEPCLAEEPSLHEKPVEGQSPHRVAPAVNPSNQEAQWQCGICPFRAAIQSEMVNHTSLKHAIKSQYKCGYCNVRSSVRTAFDNHFAAKHPDKAFRVLCMYYRLDSDDIEPLLPGGNTTSHEPLWKRNDPDRRKQIRGIYLDDEESEQEQQQLGFLGIQPGEPKGEEFVCPKCHSFKTPCMSTFRSHLCKEANYQRFECAECGITNPLLPTLRRHYTKTHGSQFSTDCYITLPVENTLEAWVESIISHQQHLIKIWKEGGGISSSPSKGAGRRSSIHSEAEEASGAVLHDSGSDKRKYVCSTCGVECRTGSGLKSHTTAMHQTKFKCQLCPFSSNMELAIQNHLTLKHPKHDGQESTRNISKQSPSTSESELLSALEDDKKVEKKPVKHDCSLCDFKTNISRAYYAHVQTHSVRLRNYLCAYCQKRFETQRDGNKHSHLKHPSFAPKIIYSPAEEMVSVNEEMKSGDAIPPQDQVFPTEAETKKPEVPDTSNEKSATVCYSCCHCSLKGPYQFVEEHLKAQHRDLPFLLRKEQDRNMYLEMYKYRCGHCLKDSDSLMEAMDHWVKNHVTLDFKFSLSLFSSTMIKSESESNASVASASGQQESGSEAPSTSSGKVNRLPSFSKVKKGNVSLKPDSSSAHFGSSDLDDDTAEDANESFSSDLVEGSTDSEIETNKVTSSTSEDKDVLARCAYCRRVSQRHSDIYDHIRTVHPDKPMKVNLYQKGEYDRLFRGVFECDTCGEQGTTAEMNKHIKSMHPGTQSKLKRIIRASQKDKICFRCDICSHVVKARKSIKSHMDRMHPGNSTSFTRMQSESNLLLSTKQPIKCNYCGDTAATIEEIESHHTFLHSHLPVNFTNLREEALLSIHKSSSSSQSTKDSVSSFSSTIPPQLPSQSPALPISTTAFPLKNKARKSFPMSFPSKRQIATKSTSGRLQLVRLRQVKEVCEEEKYEEATGENSTSISKTGLSSASSSMAVSNSASLISNKEMDSGNPLNLDEIYASVNLLGSTPMRLSVTQLSALVNLNPKIILKDVKESTVAALI